MSARSRYFASATIGGWSFETWPPASASAGDNILLEVVSEPPLAAVVAFGMMDVAVAVRSLRKDKGLTLPPKARSECEVTLLPLPAFAR